MRRRAHPERLSLRGQYKVTTRDALTGRIVHQRTYTNVICANGKAYVAQWLNQEIGTNPAIYGAIGTGAGVPAAADTQLFAELSRALLASQLRAGNVVTFDFFWTTSQANGAGTSTLTEAGVFLAGSGTANSGQLLSHVNITQTKDATKTLTVEFSLTVG